jgi:hypothetical protein
MESSLGKMDNLLKLSGIHIYILDTKIISDDMNFVLEESDFLIPVSQTELLTGFKFSTVNICSAVFSHSHMCKTWVCTQFSRDNFVYNNVKIG